MKHIKTSDWPGYVGLSLAAWDWLVALCWPQTYRSLHLYRRFSSWEEAIVICLIIASVSGFVASLASTFRREPDIEWRAVAGMVLNVPPFLVFGVLCRGLDPTGF